MRTARYADAFTLIELLVVVSIIVLLLSLLAPAMDRAIYQAELAQCGAQLRAIATGASTYAFGNDRQYPYRPGVRDPGANWQPNVLYAGNESHNALAGRAGSLHDERPVLSSFLSINAALNDPMVTPVDFEAAGPGVTAWASRMLWFGWEFRAGNGSSMTKVGSRMSAVVRQGAGVGRSERFSILASDFVKVFSDGTRLQSSHADTSGGTTEYVLQNTRWVEGGSESEAFRFVFSFWGAFGQSWGETDMNYASDDGSVARLDRQQTRFNDERLSFVEEMQSGSSGWYIGLPRLGSN